MLYCAKFYGGGFGRVYEPKTPVIKLCTVQHYSIITPLHSTKHNSTQHHITPLNSTSFHLTALQFTPYHSTQHHITPVYSTSL